MKKLATIAVTVALLGTLGACGASTDTTSVPQAVSETTSETASVSQEEYTLTYVDNGRVTVADEDCIAVYTQYTNNSNETVMPADTVDVKAFQNGIELSILVPTGQKTNGYIQCDTSVQSGTTADVVWIFQLDDESDVSIELSDGTEVTTPVPERTESEITDASSASEGTSDEADSSEAVSCDNELYNGEYGVFTLTGISSSGFQFKYENTTGTDYSLYSEYLIADGIPYEDGWIDDENYYGGIAEDISAGMSRDLEFHVPNNNTNVSTLEGSLQVCTYPDGDVQGLLTFTTSLNGEDIDYSVDGSEVYNGEYGTLTLTSISEENFIFCYYNNTDRDISLYSEYLTLDGTQYDDGMTDDDTYVGGISISVGAGMRRYCRFWVPDYEGGATSMAGQIQVCSCPDGTVLGNITFDADISNFA